MIAAGVGVAAVRWLISHGRDVFHLTPDEPVQLAIVGSSGGAASWDMLDRSTWRPASAPCCARLPVHVRTGRRLPRGARPQRRARGGVLHPALPLDRS